MNAAPKTTDLENGAPEKWEALLDPDLLRGKLISASIYIAAYELLAESIIGHIKGFFFDGINPDGPVTSPAYAEEVLSRNRSPLYASLDWLRENDVIDDADLAAFETIKKCRNELAHEMLALASGFTDGQYLEQLPVIAALIKKIETWWVVNFEIPVNPDFDNVEIDETGIVPGPCMALQLLVDIALGEPNKAKWYLEEFRRRRQRA